MKANKKQVAELLVGLQEAFSKGDLALVYEVAYKLEELTNEKYVSKVVLVIAKQLPKERPLYDVFN